MGSISTAELAIYAVLSTPVLYVCVKHGRPGLTGWLYLLAFCILRIVGGIMALKGNSSAAIVSNIGLSPLILAAVGVLHESRFYRNPALNPKVEIIFLLLFHLFVATGIALLAAGGSALQGDGPQTTDFNLVKAGIAIIAAAWAVLILWSTRTIIRTRSHAEPVAFSAGTKILWAVFLSLLFIGIRIIYALVALVTGSQILNPTTGSLAVRIVLSLLPELVGTVILIAAGLITRHIRSDLKDMVLRVQGPQSMPM